MNPQKMLKRIIRGSLLLLLFVFAFTFYTAYAVDDGTQPLADPVEIDPDTGCPKHENMCKESSTVHEPDTVTVVNRYGLGISRIANQTFEVYMTGGDSNRCNDGVTFTIVSINGLTKSESNAAIGKEVDCTHSVQIDASELPFFDNNFGLDGVDVELLSSCNVANKPAVKGTCYWSHVKGELFATRSAGTEAHTDLEQFPISLSEGSVTTSSIDCEHHTFVRNGVTGTFDPNVESFESKFCAIKEAAGSDHTYDFGSGSYSGDPLPLSCDSDVNHMYANPGQYTGEDYWVNHGYYFGSKTFTNSTNYVYHYAPGMSPTTETASCKVTCEEAVEVEYGPPVASAAGMCFEYKVRVTTRTTCNMTETPSAPTCQTDYCEPIPECWHNGGNIYTQAGPNEEFNSCVKKCDGGVYSKTCSTKCYNKVYGSISAYAKTNAVFFDEIFATAVEFEKGQNGANYDCYGYFSTTNAAAVQDSKLGKKIRAITWHGKTEDWSKDSTNAGRYYCNGWQNRDLSYREKFYSDENGFFRKVNYTSSGGLCDAYCKWTECTSSTVYLNQYVPCGDGDNLVLSDADKKKYCSNNRMNILKYDCDKNTEAYNDLIESCSTQSSCSTETAEFTVEVDYWKGSTDDDKVTVKFPYNGQKDTVTHTGNGVTTTADQANTTLLPDFPGSGEGLLGCYKANDNSTDLYRVTWGTPSTWMNLKTGEISYTPKTTTGSSGSSNKVWYENVGQFCLPGDAKPVNSRWANAYYHHIIDELDLYDDLSTSSVAISDRCVEYTTSTTSVINWQSDIGGITYNIRASARDVGLLAWDFDVSCFYAITSSLIKPENTTTTDSYCEDAEEYRVRSTDLENLFPGTEGETLTAATEVGREPGFNWSEYAINNKNGEYQSNPVAYREKLQTEAIAAATAGTEIYNSDNLDYEFYLSPSTIREMRKAVAGNMGGGNYTAFSDSGFTIDNVTGVGRYRSQKIRDIAGEKKVPDIPAINCNNMLHYGSNQCDPVHEG